MTTPTIEECLCAAAYAILTDGLPHKRRAIVWAKWFLRRVSRGHPTAFQRETCGA